MLIYLKLSATDVISIIASQSNADEELDSLGNHFFFPVDIYFISRWCGMRGWTETRLF